MKRSYIVISLTLAIGFAILFLNFIKFSINEIDADNYKVKLKKSGHSIWDCMIGNYIPDNIGLWDYGSDYQVIQPINVNVTITEESSERKLVEISDTPSTLWYQMVWVKKEPILCQIIARKYQNDSQLAKIAERLIMEKQFTLKKSSLLDGSDILIKETENDFIIVEIGGKFDYDNPPRSLSISAYSKNKYF
jgi:hypothetical protein